MAIVTSRFELVFVEDSQAAVGMGRNDVRVATAATRQSETELSYTYAAIRAQAGHYFLLETSCQILTSRESRNAMLPMTNVIAATVMG